MTTASHAIKGPDHRLVAELDKHSRPRSRLETLQRLTAALASATTLKEIADRRLLPRLFEMFSQIRSRDDRATDGTGIGLALAAQAR
jgi:hypothetical protein